MVTRAIEEITQVIHTNVKSESNSSDLPHHVSSVHYVLSSPWVISQAKKISMSFKEDTAISRAYVAGIIWEERAKMTNNTIDDISVIEEKVFDVRLNGYSVSSWESKHTRELGISFVVSVAGNRMIDLFVKACENIVHNKKYVHFHSSLFLQHIGIQKISPNLSNYALIHIHGELTDIAIIHTRECSFFGSYPFGIRTIIRSIAKKTKTTDDVAESTLNLVMSGDTDVTKFKEETSIIENMKQGWIGELGKLLKTSSTLETVPSHVIISADIYEDFFFNSFKSAYPQSSLESLSFESIQSHVSYGTHAGHLRLTGVYVIAIHSLIK
jgi:cell division ATPase FtsA